MKKLNPKHPKYSKIAAKIAEAEKRAASNVDVAKKMAKERAAIHSSTRARGRITR